MIQFNNLSNATISFSALKKLGEKILAEEGICESEEINCIFTDNEYIQELNVTYRKRDNPTDVLVFSFAEGEGSEYRKELYGEIYISVEMASENAKKYTNTLTEELTLLFVHGILHLVGYNDESESDRKIMKEKERHYLKKNG